MKPEQSVYQGYLYDLITLLRDVALETVQKIDEFKKSPSKSQNDLLFQEGRLLADQEVLTFMMHQLETFQIQLKDVNFDKVDQKLLLCDKPQE